jgi:uncharacterized protein (TIGR01440 family)
MTDIYRGADAQINNELAAEVKNQAKTVISEILENTTLKAGDIFVVGCSSSEIVGSNIGKGSSFEAAKVVYDVISNALEDKGIFLAAQRCEHLNRAIVVERKCAEKYGCEIVSVIPQPKAGGSFATLTYENMRDPVVVEHIKAHAGLDIGGTLIGMHLRDVAVPMRLSLKAIGEANINSAYTRPKYIGGPRAQY